jgi:cell division protein FtsB
MEGIYIVLALAGVIIVFLIARELVTWYWKVNEIITHQKSTNTLLKEQNEILKANNQLLQEFVDDFKNS